MERMELVYYLRHIKLGGFEWEWQTCPERWTTQTNKNFA